MRTIAPINTVTAGRSAVPEVPLPPLTTMASATVTATSLTIRASVGGLPGYRHSTTTSTTVARSLRLALGLEVGGEHLIWRLDSGSYVPKYRSQFNSCLESYGLYLKSRQVCIGKWQLAVRWGLRIFYLKLRERTRSTLRWLRLR